MTKNENYWYDLVSLEDYMDRFDDELYIEYMETGTYYDTEYEDFVEWKYESYISELIAGVAQR